MFKKILLSVSAMMFIAALQTGSAAESNLFHLPAGGGLSGGLTDTRSQLADSGLEINTSGTGLIVAWTNFALGFVSVIAILMIIIGGFMYISSGVEDANKEKGKKYIEGAIIGIVIILSAYAIVNTLLAPPATPAVSTAATVASDDKS